jgi:putative intracellular protease/amidase/YHS domain-containing protein
MKLLMIAFAMVVGIVSCKSKNVEPSSVKKSHDELVAEMFPKPKVNIKTVGVLLYDGYSTLDAMGPYNVLGELMGTNVFFVGIHRGAIADSRGMKVLVDTSIADVKHLDILVIPGGFKETWELTKDSALLTWIRAIDSSSIYTCSVCTGAWILGATGLLKDKPATTHWWGKKILADNFGAKVQDERYTRSGKYWTSAGITAGIDMSLALINEIRGEKYTKVAMLDLEYDPKPPFKGGSDRNTDASLVSEVRSMYDEGMEEVLHPEIGYKNMKFDNIKDLYCGMPLKAGVGDTAHYKGKVYGFCSKECKDEFEKNPAAYLAEIDR